MWSDVRALLLLLLLLSSFHDAVAFPNPKSEIQDVDRRNPQHTAAAQAQLELENVGGLLEMYQPDIQPSGRYTIPSLS